MSIEIPRRYRGPTIEWLIITIISGHFCDGNSRLSGVDPLLWIGDIPYLKLEFEKYKWKMILL